LVDAGVPHVSSRLRRFLKSQRVDLACENFCLLQKNGLLSALSQVDLDANLARLRGGWH
jgi:hypothetical protein